MAASDTNHIPVAPANNLQTHTGEEPPYPGSMPISYESVLNWCDSVDHDKSGKWTTVRVKHDSHYVKIFLPICYSPAFQDIICHSIFCIQDYV